jgi:hypothetical protein
VARKLLQEPEPKPRRECSASQISLELIWGESQVRADNVKLTIGKVESRSGFRDADEKLDIESRYHDSRDITQFDLNRDIDRAGPR